MRYLLAWACYHLQVLVFLLHFSRFPFQFIFIWIVIIVFFVCVFRRNLDYQEVLDALKSKGISIRVASPKLVMEEVHVNHVLSLSEVVFSVKERSICKNVFTLASILD